MAKTVSKEKTKELALDYTAKRIQSALILLLCNIADLRDEHYLDYEFKTPSELEDITGFIVDTVKNMDVTLLKQSEDRQSIIGRISERKNALASIAECLYSYQYALEDISDKLQNQFTLAGLKKINLPPLSKKRIIGDCLDFVSGDADNSFNPILATEIISCFPVKMAREKYFDYMRGALSSFFANYTDTFADGYVKYMLNKTAPQENINYGKYFDDILSSIKEFYELDFDSLTEDAIPPLFDKASDLNLDIEAVFDDLNIVFESLNNLQIIFTFADDLDRFLENSFILKDAFYTTVNSLRANEYELFEDNLNKLFDEQTITFIESANQAYKKFSNALKQLSPENADDELNLIITAAGIIDDIFYSDMEKLCLPFVGKNSVLGQKINPDTSSEIISRFLDGIKKRLEELPNKQRKNVRQKLLKLVPCHFSADEFTEYISGAFDDAADFDEQAIILEKISYVFEKYDYTEQDDGDEDDLHHEHSEHCGCEHD